MFEPERFEIWPEHLDVLEMFLRYDVQDRKQLFSDLQLMEGHALQLIAESAQKQQKAARRKARKP